MFVLDTDHLTHLAWGQSPQARRLVDRLARVASDQVATTIVNYEEQTRGWLSLLARARTLPDQVDAYRRLGHHLDNFRHTPVLGFDEAAAAIMSRLLKSRLGLGTMDLRIAAIVLAHDATLLSCNLRDFRQVPGLTVEDWTM